jgi:hypothetical protein
MAQRPLHAPYGLSVGNTTNVIDSTGNITAVSVTTNTITANVLDTPSLDITGNLTIANVLTANQFVGGGAGITGLNAAALASGTVNSTRLSGTYSISITGSANTANTAAVALERGSSQHRGRRGLSQHSQCGQLHQRQSDF